MSEGMFSRDRLEEMYSGFTEENPRAPYKTGVSEDHFSVAKKTLHAVLHAGVVPIESIVYNKSGWNSKIGSTFTDFMVRKVFSHVGSQNAEETGFVECYVGKDPETDIRSTRSVLQNAGTEDYDVLIAEETTRIAEKYHMNASHVYDLLSSQKEVSIPDVVSVLVQDGQKIVRIAESKITGENDSKAVSKNVQNVEESVLFDAEDDELENADDLNGTEMFDNSGVVVEKAIVLLTTRDKDAEGVKHSGMRFPMASRWINYIRGKEYQIGVFCNEEVIGFCSGSEVSREHYERIVDFFAESEAEKIISDHEV